MMHHPNMHHQAMSGHPPQHLGGHQGMPAHHQIPPHQMHRENRHVPMTRLPMGPSQASMQQGTVPGLGGMGGALGVPPHHAPAQRPPHPIRAMPHHPQGPPHTAPPGGMKGMRRGYPVSGAYPSAAPVMTPYTQPLHTPPPGAVPSVSAQTSISAPSPSSPPEAPPAEGVPAVPDDEGPTTQAATAVANSKEKTPMCLVNELARYNKIKHQYRLTSEMGPAHKKVFTVTLRLGEAEEYTSEGSSIKRAQHAAASSALTQTRYPAPPVRQQPAHAQHHHRHSVMCTGAVMPTVELNALAMKLCQPAVYTVLPPVPPGPRARLRTVPPFRLHPSYIPPPYTNQRLASPGMIYRVRVSVGGRSWLGEGPSPQGARHDAAARALMELRPAPAALVPDPTPDTPPAENDSDLISTEVKSPVSLVHELALKKNLTVMFSVKSERGPPHMRVFITTCTVGDMETEGEGNGKKVSKRSAAERMLEEMRRRWPPALLRARPPSALKRKMQPAKKKTRNLIKENGETGGGDNNPEAADNPISRLAMVRHAARARSPQYRVVEERGVARRREFLVQCDAPPHSATGLGPNKKTAKRRAAHNVLLAIEMGLLTIDGTDPPSANTEPATAVPADVTKTNGDVKKKESECPTSEVRQPVPGVLLMDYHQRQPATVSSDPLPATGSPGAKDQLMYLSQLLGFSVQFSDFPKRNHGEYLSLVSLSTDPPVMCHGGGSSTAHSHEQCSRAALRALALMGLDAPHDTELPSREQQQHIAPTACQPYLELQPSPEP